MVEVVVKSIYMNMEFKENIDYKLELRIRRNLFDLIKIDFSSIKTLVGNKDLLNNAFKDTKKELIVDNG
jgi:hypothetical protein